MGRPTHKDIARAAGTSQTTVSLVLGRRESGLKISASTREAVLRAARELGYVADLSARRLRGSGAATAPDLVLALLRPVGASVGPTLQLVDALDAALGALPGAPQLVLERYTPGRLAEQPGLVGGARFHGALVTGLSPDDEAALEELDLPVPLVAFQRAPRRHAFVDVDSVAGAAAAVRHLLARGRRRIAALTQASPPSRAQQARVSGFWQALREAGLEGAGRLLEVQERDPTQAVHLTAALLGDWQPDALVALSGPLVLGALRALHRAGRRVPEDVAVVSYEDLEYAAQLVPSLTCVRLPYGEMASAAAHWLADSARGQPVEPLRRVFTPELVVRESTG
jgi:DNA-binding LacI/PurR family transcriptional regulator